MLNRTRTFVIVVNGAAGCGKDTFMDMCEEYCNDYESANVLRLSAIDPVKDIIRSLGWDGTKTDEVRDMLSRLKQFWVDNQDGPTMYLFTNIMNFHQSHMGNDNIIFCCIREPKEIKKLINAVAGVEIFGMYSMTVLIQRVGTIITAENSSDDINNIINYNYHKIIANSGTLEDLKKQAHEYIDAILK